jgi:hypothetical protein
MINHSRLPVEALAGNCVSGEIALKNRPGRLARKRPGTVREGFPVELLVAYGNAAHWHNFFNRLGLQEILNDRLINFFKNRWRDVPLGDLA